MYLINWKGFLQSTRLFLVGLKTVQSPGQEEPLSALRPCPVSRPRGTPLVLETLSSLQAKRNPSRPWDLVQSPGQEEPLLALRPCTVSRPSGTLWWVSLGTPRYLLRSQGKLGLHTQIQILWRVSVTDTCKAISICRCMPATRALTGSVRQIIEEEVISHWSCVHWPTMCSKGSNTSPPTIHQPDHHYPPPPPPKKKEIVQMTIYWKTWLIKFRYMYSG
jgi:hypothetical protein